VPDPNSFTPIPVPLLQAGEVSGRAVVIPGIRSIRGLEVELRNVDSGDTYTARTFSDGTFYLLGVRPGAYEATVSQEVLDELGMSVEPAYFVIGTSADEVFIEDVIVVLVRP
jgi:hypothetical protein